MSICRQSPAAFLLTAALWPAPLAVAAAADVPLGIVLQPPVVVVSPSPEFIPAPIAPPPTVTGVAPPAPLPPQVIHVAPILVMPRVIPPPAPAPSRR